MSMSNDIPSGSYTCALVTDEDGLARFPITTDSQRILVIEVALWLFAKGAEQPFTQIKKTETIDPTQPARGGTETTPYEFMALTLRNLGADPNRIDDAVAAGLESEDGHMVFPGEPRAAVAEVSYKAGNKGTFMNVKVQPIREVTQDARTAALEAIRARKAAAKPQASPFVPAGAGRGQPMSPPPARGGAANPFAPRTAG